MTYEERARIAATLEGWSVDEDDRFARLLDNGQVDVITLISPSDIGAWGLLCNMEGVDVPNVIDSETFEAAVEMGYQSEGSSPAAPQI